jgi:hypothetical protein
VIDAAVVAAGRAPLAGESAGTPSSPASNDRDVLRDTLLADCLASIYNAHRDETFDVAVVYGAGHMPAITRELNRRFGYRPRRAEWLTVFDF